MSLEQGIADLGPVVTIWKTYRLCPICRAEPGQPCTSRFSTVQAGRPDGPPKVLAIAHGFRKHARGR